MKLIIGLLCSFLASRLFVHAQDWANLNRYHAANDSIEALKLHDTRVVFMGNSITENWGKMCPDFFTSHDYIDRGISGQTSPQMLLRFRPDVIALHPKVVVIMAGTNDIAGNTGPSTLGMIENNIASMCDLAKVHHIRVVLSSVLPAYDFPWRKGLQPAEKIIALNKWIKAYSEKKGLVYLDYFSRVVDHRNGFQSDLTIDGVHPNKAGYEVMMPMVEKAIDEALHQK